MLKSSVYVTLDELSTWPTTDAHTLNTVIQSQDFLIAFMPQATTPEESFALNLWFIKVENKTV